MPPSRKANMGPLSCFHQSPRKTSLRMRTAEERAMARSGSSALVASSSTSSFGFETSARGRSGGVAAAPAEVTPALLNLNIHSRLTGVYVIVNAGVLRRLDQHLFGNGVIPNGAVPAGWCLRTEQCPGRYWVKILSVVRVQHSEPVRLKCLCGTAV